jgi:pyruvate kinase
MANALEHLAIQTKLEWTASLNTEFQPEKNYRRTSIIGTIGMSLSPEASQAADFPTKLYVTGPKTNSAEKISMLRSGIVNRVSSALAQLLT